MKEVGEQEVAGGRIQKEKDRQNRQVALQNGAAPFLVTAQ